MPENGPHGDNDAGARQSLFLNSLEQWIIEIVTRDGLADRELVGAVKERFERSMQANIDHHKFMMSMAKEDDDQTAADRHRLIADVYKALVE